MIEEGDPGRDLAALAVPQTCRLVATGNRYEPYQVIDPDGAVMDGAAQFFRDLLAAGKAESTVRSYGTDLLRWLRFCWAVRVDWDRATRTEARDFSRWLQVAGKQPRPHWRAGPLAPVSAGAAGGKAYAPSVRAHSETVLRAFYDFHLDAGTGPVINPFPLDRSRRHGRAHAHHNPMEPYGNERSGLYRPKVPSRVPRSIPDGEFNEIFARLPSHRDRALVAFYVYTGARASELLSATVAGTDPGRQVITVTRKGTRELQELPASADAFVWLRLYQVEMDGLVPKGRRQSAGRAGEVAVLPSSVPEVSVATVNRKLAATSAFYAHQARNNEGPGDLLAVWRTGGRGGWKPFLHHVSKGKPYRGRAITLKVPKKLPRILTVAETQAILDACGRLRDRFFFALMHETGCRAGEVLGLRHEDIAAAECEITIVARENANGARAKSGGRTVPVGPELIRLYADYLHEEYGPALSDYVFINIWAEPKGQAWSYPAAYDLVLRLRARTGLDFDPHWFRHSAATRWLRDGVSIEVVSKLLGHSSVTTTSATYGHLTIEDARAALEKAGWLTGREVTW